MENEATVVDLARRVGAGYRGSLGALLRELEPVVVRTARLIVGSGSWAAEDAAQEALECSLGTVKSNLHDARRRLTVALTERGLAPTVRTSEIEETA